MALVINLLRQKGGFAPQVTLAFANVTSPQDIWTTRKV